MALYDSGRLPRKNRPLKQGEALSRDVKKNKPSRVRRGLMGFAIVVFVGGGLYVGQRLMVLATEWTEVQQVAVMGLNRLTKEEVLDKLAMPQPASLLWLSTDELASRIQAHPWIDVVEVDRVFPHSLVVQVTEREPAAILRAPKESVMLDSAGHVLPGELPAEVKRLPVVQGLTAQSVAALGSEGHPRAKQGIRIAHLLAQYFSGRPQVNVSEPYTTVVDLPTVRFQFGQNAEEQWQRFLVLYPTIKSEMDRQAQEVDLRFSQKVILRKRTM
ncbi:MAG: cell division protein FtsQ/DivIB [Nitrospirales bacterium]|nr:FtsQ-type POTRA domain-containing protein [Nitrospirales bacterium]